MVTKAGLGTGYLVSIGVGLAALAASGALVRSRSVAGGPSSLLAAVSVFGLAAAFVVTGLWLGRSNLSGESVWKVAQWATLGLGVPTLVVVLVSASDGPTLAAANWPTVAVNNIAVGGIVGVLLGAVTELRRLNRRSSTLNQRNAVFNRVLRHDIRNSMNLVEGHLERIEAGRGDVEQSAEVIHDQVEHVVELSHAARRLDELNDDRPLRPVDLTALAADQLDVLRERHPEAVVETDLDDVVVRANELLASVVENLLANAVEHSDGRARVRVAVDQEGGTGVLRVTDDGPGFPQRELEVHTSASETDLQHSDGVGLWLSRWVVESYGGELSLENRVDDEGLSGARVTVYLPTADG